MKKKAIITGITGQDGAYLSNFLINKGYEVIGIIRSYNNSSFDKLNYLGLNNQIVLEECDLLDMSQVIKILSKHRPAEVYNLAAQSSVSLSFNQPIGTFRFNTLSVLNFLESIKVVDEKIKFYQASTSEMYGRVKGPPVTEETPMHPLSPYAISKASAHWLAVNYRESYHLFACCGILFNHESFLRSSNFFVKKIIRESFNIKNGKQAKLNVGNIDIKRDFGYAPKYVEAMWLMLQQEYPDDYVICSGKSIALRDIIYYVFDRLKISRDRISIDPSLYRPVDILDIYGSSAKAREKIGWNYDMNFFAVLDILISEEEGVLDI